MRIYYQLPQIPWRTERTHLIMEQGLVGWELVKNPNDADYIILPSTFYGLHMLRYPNPFPPEKTIFLDWWDTTDCHSLECFCYYKRSWASHIDHGDYVEKTHCEWPSHYRPLSFCALNEFIVPEVERTIDVGCFLTPYYKNRRNVIEVVNNLKMVKQVGVVGDSGVKGRSGFNEDFYRAMRSCRVVVTCQPDRWEGDYRTWEALASGALVFVDKLITPLVHPLVDGEHCIFYDVGNLSELKEKLEHYAYHREKAETIARRGHEFVLKHHMAINRVQDILKMLKKNY